MAYSPNPNCYRLKVRPITLDRCNSNQTNQRGQLGIWNHFSIIRDDSKKISEETLSIIIKDFYDNKRPKLITYGKIVWNKFENKVAYEGILIGNKPVGSDCKVYWHNGNQCYEGGLDKMGQRSGYGKEYYQYGDQRYEGNFKNCDYHGENLIVYSQKDTCDSKHNIEFEGNLIEGRPDGYIKKYKCSKSIFDNNYYFDHDYLYCMKGYCSNGYIEDKNVILRACIHPKYQNNPVDNLARYPLVYVGDFTKGKFNGKGKLYKFDDYELPGPQVFLHQNDLLDGNKINYQEYLSYEGGFVNNLRDGNNCKQYENLKDGIVNITYLQYHGGFKLDKFNGRGVYYVSPRDLHEYAYYTENILFDFCTGFQSTIKRIQFSGYFKDNQPDFNYNNGKNEIVESNMYSISVLIYQDNTDSKGDNTESQKKRLCERYYRPVSKNMDTKQSNFKVVANIDETLKMNEENAIVYADMPKEVILYKGSIKNGEYNGKGVLYNQNGGVSSEGIFLNGIIHSSTNRVTRDTNLLMISLFIGPIENGIPASIQNKGNDKIVIYTRNGKKQFMGNFKIQYDNKYNFGVTYHRNGQIEKIGRKSETGVERIVFTNEGKFINCSKNFYESKKDSNFNCPCF